MRAACACLAAVASLPTISALSPAEGPQPRTEFTIARTEAPEETQGALADLLARRLEEYDLSYSYDGELTCPLLYECGRREVTCGSVVSGDTTGGIDCSAELEDNDDSPYAYSVHQDTKEMVYTLVLDEPGATVRISTCNEGTDANFDTYLHLLDGCVGTHLAYVKRETTALLLRPRATATAASSCSCVDCGRPATSTTTFTTFATFTTTTD